MHKILFLDDSVEEMELLKIMLDMGEFSVPIQPHIVYNVEELRAALSDDLTAIVSDWNLIDGTAPDVAALVREQYKDMPLFFVSGNFNDEMRAKIAPFKPAGCFEKEISCNHLHKIIALL